MKINISFCINGYDKIACMVNYLMSLPPVVLRLSISFSLRLPSTFGIQALPDLGTAGIYLEDKNLQSLHWLGHPTISRLPAPPVHTDQNLSRASIMLLTSTCSFHLLLVNQSSSLPIYYIAWVWLLGCQYVG